MCEVFAVGTLGAMPASFAFAQEARPNSPVVDEIVVTARRDPTIDYGQRLLVDPVSTGKYNDDGFATLRELVPGAGTFNVNSTQSFVALRGAVSLDESVSADPSVAIYIDDFYIGRGPASRLRMPDVEFVEVYAGPQGTRFGKNALGGAVNFVTTQLSSTEHSEVVATLRSDEHYGVGANFRGEAGSQARYAVGAYGAMGGDYTHNKLTGRGLGNRDEAGIYGKLQFELGDARYLWLSASLQHESADLEPRFLVYNTKPAFPAIVESSSDDVFESNDPETRNRVGRLVVKLGVDGTALTGWQVIAGIQRTRTNVDNNDFAPGGGLTTILATRTKDNEDAGSAELRTWTQIQKLSAIGGFLIRRSNLYRSEDFILDPAPGTQAAVVFGDPSKQNFVGQKTQNTELAAFATLGIDITDGIEVELGGRYSRDIKRGRTSILGDNPTFLLRSSPFDVGWKNDWNNFTHRASLNIQATSSSKLIASWSTGFKAGGFTNSVNNPVSAATPFKPEHANSLEAKWLYTLPRSYGQVEVDLFSTKYRDLQTLSVRSDPSAGIIQEVTNAGRSRAKGVDFSYNIDQVVVRTRISASYLEAQYTDFKTADPTRGLLDFSGQPVPLSPKWALRLRVDAGEKGVNGSGVVPGFRVLYRSKVSFFPDGSQSALIRDITDLLDLSAWTTVDTRFGSFTVSANNILDQRPFTFANNASSSFYYSGQALGAGARLVYGSRTPGRTFSLAYRREL